MARTPVNVLVLPFRVLPDGKVEHAVFLRADGDDPFWQCVAGGVEEGEAPLGAARRELEEETGFSAPRDLWIALDTRGSVPGNAFRDAPSWGPDTYVVRVSTFAVDVSSAASDIALTHEHSEHRWLDYEAAAKLVRYDLDRTALWELNERLARRAGR
jgi:dATP pyrophosphohydrolase